MYEDMHFLYHIQSTGRYFLAFWGPMKTENRSAKDYIVNIFDRSSGALVRRLTDLHGKPDLVRVVDDLGSVSVVGVCEFDFEAFLSVIAKPNKLLRTV